MMYLSQERLKLFLGGIANDTEEKTKENLERFKR